MFCVSPVSPFRAKKRAPFSHSQTISPRSNRLAICQRANRIIASVFRPLFSGWAVMNFSNCMIVMLEFKAPLCAKRLTCGRRNREAQDDNRPLVDEVHDSKLLSQHKGNLSPSQSQASKERC